MSGTVSRPSPTTPVSSTKRNIPETPVTPQDWTEAAHRLINLVTREPDAKQFLQPTTKHPSGKFLDSLQVKLKNNIYPDFNFFLKEFRGCLKSWLRTEPEKAKSLLNTLQTEVQKIDGFETTKMNLNGSTASPHRKRKAENELNTRKRKRKKLVETPVSHIKQKYIQTKLKKNEDENQSNKIFNMEERDVDYDPKNEIIVISSSEDVSEESGANTPEMSLTGREKANNSNNQNSNSSSDTTPKMNTPFPQPPPNDEHSRVEKRKLRRKARRKNNNLNSRHSPVRTRNQKFQLKFDYYKSYECVLENIKIDAHGVSLSGKSKPWNQDCLSLHKFTYFKHHEFVALTVYDGHGLLGHNAAPYCAKIFPVQLGVELNQNENINKNFLEKCVETAIYFVHKELCNISKNEAEMFGLWYEPKNKIKRKIVDYGTTLSNVLIMPNNNVLISTVGDSTVVILQVDNENKANFVWKSIDHNLECCPEEEERVKKCGGVITKKADNCEARLIPPSESASNLAINMTRSVGHQILSRFGLTWEPHHYHLNLNSDDDYLFIIASDGLWDVTTLKSVIELVNKNLPLGIEAINKVLAYEANRLWKQHAARKADDVTIITSRVSLKK